MKRSDLDRMTAEAWEACGFSEAPLSDAPPRTREAFALFARELANRIVEFFRESEGWRS